MWHACAATLTTSTNGKAEICRAPIVSKQIHTTDNYCLFSVHKIHRALWAWKTHWCQFMTFISTSVLFPVGLVTHDNLYSQLEPTIHHIQNEHFSTTTSGFLSCLFLTVSYTVPEKIEIEIWLVFLLWDQLEVAAYNLEWHVLCLQNDDALLSGTKLYGN